MAVHVVNISLVNTNGAGQVKPKTRMTIGEAMQSNLEHRILPNPNVPNSNNYPDLEQYLISEDSDGFSLIHLDQTLVITST